MCVDWSCSYAGSGSIFSQDFIKDGKEVFCESTRIEKRLKKFIYLNNSQSDRNNLKRRDEELQDDFDLRLKFLRDF